MSDLRSVLGDDAFPCRWCGHGLLLHKSGRGRLWTRCPVGRVRSEWIRLRVAWQAWRAA